jgi:hypothetical protein
MNCRDLMVEVLDALTRLIKRNALQRVIPNVVKTPIVQ